MVRALIVAALAVVLVDPQPALAQQPTAVGHGGAAATVDALGTQAALDTLRHGGNAVDAAIAAAGVLGVVEPYSCGIGGGGFMVIRTPGGKVTTIDSRELSPAAMRPDSFFSNGVPPAKLEDVRYTGLSAGVPGTVAGWDRALRRYGTESLAQVLRPGIRAARRGFVVDDTFVEQTEDNVPYFDDVPSTARLYLDADGTPRDAGTVLRNPDLAATYSRIARGGADAFYDGPIAAAIVAAARRPPIAAGADHVWRPGLVTRSDVAAYTAPEREPTHVRHRGLDVWSMGPPSSGGSTVGEALNILSGYPDLAADRTGALHLFLEASRLSFADRNAYVADPAFVDVPLDRLLSDGFAAQRRALIDEHHAGTSPAAPGEPERSTTHLVVADREGTVVSYTFTIESIGGNGIVVPGYGFLLNNELTDFDYTATDRPNSAAGHKRPRSSMAPTIVTRNGRPFLAVGSPGGASIITTVLQVLMQRLDLGDTLPEAIARPRVSQRNGATTEAEPALIASPEGAALASDYGHVFKQVDELGAVTALEHLGGGRLLAAAEPLRRGGGSAAVVRP
ncbi:MAG: gamma-glutamyltranspeptidase / glutathione hydrolase, partial [Thermoleophilaceae bacterium]|nr:gamma-glutamyltranspeptidase / glutathione hydrolase [Thermoleophilaceae bacterium]